jgi:hypothetical protein
MGLNLQTTINNTVNKTLATVAVSQLQTIAQDNEQNIDVSQNVGITISGKLSCASLTIENDAKISMKSINIMTAQQQAQLFAAIQAQMASAADNAIAQVNKDINFGQSNISTTVNQAINDTTVQQSLAMTQALTQTIGQFGNATQTITLIVTNNGVIDVPGDCTFTNNLSIEYVAQQVCFAAQQAVIDDVVKTAAYTTWKNTVSQSNKGISIGAIIGYVILGLVLVIGIALVIKYRKEIAASIKKDKEKRAARMENQKRIDAEKKAQTPSPSSSSQTPSSSTSSSSSTPAKSTSRTTPSHSSSSAKTTSVTMK